MGGGGLREAELATAQAGWAETLPGTGPSLLGERHEGPRRATAISSISRADPAHSASAAPIGGSLCKNRGRNTREKQEGGGGEAEERSR